MITHRKPKTGPLAGSPGSPAERSVNLSVHPDPLIAIRPAHASRPSERIAAVPLSVTPGLHRMNLLYARSRWYFLPAQRIR